MTVKILEESNMASVSKRGSVRPWRRRGRESGASLVEVVLLMPVMMLLLFGMVDFGRYVFLAIEVHSAARAGAQYGALSLANSSNTSGVQTAACNDVPDITPCPSAVSGMNVVVQTPPSCYCANAPGTTVTCGTYPTNPCTSGNQIVLLTVNTSATFSP